MKIIVTHDSPDMDAVTSVWLIKRFLPNWENAKVEYVPAGERLNGSKNPPLAAIEKIKDDEIIHVDTGLGPLDHHETSDDKVCAASRTWDFVKVQNSGFADLSDKVTKKIEALDRIVRVVVDIDHFKEALWPNPSADYFEFFLENILEGLKVQKPNQNELYTKFIMDCLDALLYNFENRVWAEEEIKKAERFKTSKGEGLGFEIINDSAVKLAQRMGYVLVIRRDPRKGYVRIKARPDSGIDLTPVYEQLKKMDPDATWFLHVSKKMLLNGSAKNPKMRPTKLKLSDIINVLKSL
ncbi:MAG TPA: DHH family phosphoesterase [Patescibacteria group bacterium]|nr:DHH family phosphoesterase [Patescibacteria group bacterium]